MMQRPRATFVALGVLLLVLIAAAGCSSDGPTLNGVTARGPYGAGVATLELVDTSRPTEPNRDFPGAPERVLTVEVWFPAQPTEAPEARNAPLAAEGAPYPLIVFAHGFSSSRRQSVEYTTHLASHGYVVAAPDFPLTSLQAPGGPRLTGVLHQPDDVSFVIDSLLQPDGAAADFLAGAVDPGAIGITGHSLGGLTTLLTVYGLGRDERIGAALPIAAPACFMGRDLTAGVSTPVMHVVGTHDLVVPLSSSRLAYDAGSAPRYWVELAGANHVQFADLGIDDSVAQEFLERLGRGATSSLVQDASALSGILGADIVACADRSDVPADGKIELERQQQLLRAFATPFFDAYLRGDTKAREFLQDELPELLPDARVEFDAGG